jgi:hypothetical protein
MSRIFVLRTREGGASALPILQIIHCVHTLPSLPEDAITGVQWSKRQHQADAGWMHLGSLRLLQSLAGLTRSTRYKIDPSPA